MSENVTVGKRGRKPKFISKSEAAEIMGCGVKTLPTRLSGSSVETKQEGRTTTYRLTDIREAAKSWRKLNKQTTKNTTVATTSNDSSW